MGYIIMAYAAEGYEEYILPDLDNSNYEILLQKKVYSLSRDLTVKLEIMDGAWKFVKQGHYQLKTPDGSEGWSMPFENGMVFKLYYEGCKVTIVVLASQKNFPAFAKYSLSYINQITVGKEQNNTIVYDFMGYISRDHAIIYKYENRWLVKDNSSNGTYINNHRVHDQEYLNFGDEITIFGLKIVFLDNYIAVCALTGDYMIRDLNLVDYHPRQNLRLEENDAKEDIRTYFKRAPRTVEKLYTDEIEIELPPQANASKKRPLFMTIGPSFTMVIPMLMGCIMSILGARSRDGSGGAYMFTGVVTALSSAIIGVAWALVNIRYANKEEEENETLRFNAYSQYLIDITSFIKEKYDYNRDIMFRTYLSGQECCSFGRGDAELWNHNNRQADFLTVRLGLGTIPFQAQIRVPKEKFTLKTDELSEKPYTIRDSYSNLYKVPVCMDIQKKGVIGVVGGLDKAGAYQIVFNMVAQLAANTCYTDLKMVFIYSDSPKNARRWGFARWLPHVWMDDKKTRLIAGNKDELGDILYELSGVLRRRTEDKASKIQYPIPHYVVFVDDMELLQGEILEKNLYAPVPEYGITTILLAERYEDLPNSCEQIIQNDANGRVAFHVFDECDRSKDLEFEAVSEVQLEQLARRLCDVEVNETVESGEIPNSLDFFEMYGVSTLEQLNVLDRWKKNRSYENMRVPIGQKNGGNTCYLDIHEKYHGPHGLVAGTTGSGKSETLQTYILSLAVNFSPDDIAFFIIDFKGGGMANLFSGLPHMAGQISNLSGNQVRRAMISIKSENMRRQRIFAQHNVNNINLYSRLYKNHEAEFPVPHLFIIIDEFAELKREEPEFMKELISVAQVGRSLGVHLILATQKPSGTVDDNIWSNSKFRLCLRVQDKQDSNDMLHKADAAYITQAGRGFLQVGNDEIFEQFQSGFSGAEYVDDPNANRASVAELMTVNGKIIASGGYLKKHSNNGTKPRTQLDAVIDYLNETAKKYNYDKRMLLWLPVLPAELYLNEFDSFNENCYRDGVWCGSVNTGIIDVVVGLYDDPERQSQGPLHINFTDGGNLAVCGMVSTGKSTFLQTLLYALVMKYSPKDLNLYVLDYSSRMLLPFGNAPHCGGVVTDTDNDKVKKFFFMMGRIMEERKQLFKGGNFTQYLQANKGRDTLPAIIIAIDNYANFREKTGCVYDEEMIRFSREGMGYGIYLVLTSAGFGTNEIPTRVGDNMRTVISLEMGDKFKYAENLRVTRVEQLPESGVKGRGLAFVHGNILEFQTAMAVKADDAFELSSGIGKCCKGMADNWIGNCAREIPVIPEHPVFSEFKEKAEYLELLNNRRYLPFAYLSQDASVYGVDLWTNYCYIIQGRGGTGKTNVLKILLYAAAKKENAEVHLIELKSSELKNTAEQLGINYVSNEKEVYELFKYTVPIFRERNLKKRGLVECGLEQIEIAEKMSVEKQIYVFVADLAAFVKSAYTATADIGDIHSYLENITEKGSIHGFYFIAALNTEQVSGIAGYAIYQNMISYRAGIHLGGNIGTQRMFQFSNIPFQEQNKASKAGLGIVPSGEDYAIAQNVVLPLVKGGLV